MKNRNLIMRLISVLFLALGISISLLAWPVLASNANSSSINPSSSRIHLPPASSLTASSVPTIYLPIVIKPSQSSGVYLLTNHSSYTSGNYLYIVGEVYNNTTEIIHYQKVIADLFNSDGTLLDTDYTYITQDNIPPGSKACYKIMMSEPSGWAYYKLSGTYHTGGKALPNIAVYNVSAGPPSYDDDGYRIVGLARNDQEQQVTYVQPNFTLYDAGGNVADCDFTYVSTTDLDPGEVNSFENSFWGRSTYTNITSYQIVVDGYYSD